MSPPKHHPSFSSPVQSYKTFIPGLQGEGRRRRVTRQLGAASLEGKEANGSGSQETCPDPALPLLSDGGPVPIDIARGVPLLVANSSCVSPALLQPSPLPQLLSSEPAAPPRPSPTVLWGFSIRHSQGCSDLMVGLVGTGSTATLAGDRPRCNVSLRQAASAVGVPCTGLWGCSVWGYGGALCGARRTFTEP